METMPGQITRYLRAKTRIPGSNPRSEKNCTQESAKNMRIKANFRGLQSGT